MAEPLFRTAFGRRAGSPTPLQFSRFVLSRLALVCRLPFFCHSPVKRLPLSELQRVVAGSFCLPATFCVSELARALNIPVVFKIWNGAWVFQLGAETFSAKDPTVAFTIGMEAVHRRILDCKLN